MMWLLPLHGLCGIPELTETEWARGPVAHPLANHVRLLKRTLQVGACGEQTY